MEKSILTDLRELKIHMNNILRDFSFRKPWALCKSSVRLILYWSHFIQIIDTIYTQVSEKGIVERQTYYFMGNARLIHLLRNNNLGYREQTAMDTPKAVSGMLTKINLGNQVHP